VECLPLYQAIELLRLPALGDVTSSVLLSAGYLIALGAVATWLANRRLRALLTP
jgi:lipooligosaccharide transport system permease protein